MQACDHGAAPGLEIHAGVVLQIWT